MATPNDLLRIEAGEIGYSRYSDPQEGTKYGRWYADLVKQAWFGTNGVAFCAMGQSWAFAKAGMDARSVGLPAAGCGTIRDAAIRNGREVKNRRDAKPGDIVLFRWDGRIDARDYSDHVGMVERNMGSAGIQTIEFNTGNGRVLRRSRSWGVVQMIVRPPYSGTSGGTSGGSSSGYADCRWLQRIVGATADNILGPDTGKRVGAIQMASMYHGTQFPYGVKYVQKVIGTTPDGIWGIMSKTAHDVMVKRIQEGFGIKVDGILGKDTDSHIHALHLASNHTV